MLIRIILLFSFSHFFFTSQAQVPQKLTSGEIHAAIKKLNFLGSVLYVAAHPDDENTRLISYLANHKNAYTTYLSLTRGDGGQNLVGTEIGKSLGVIRTQELLAARRIDGGHQTFTRANDFGYSKHPEETFRFWDKEKVLADVVWAIRKYQPDIIINRFDHRTPGRTHGHHTGSAMLSMEAFDLSGLKNEYSEQLEFVRPWKASKIFFNTSWWFYGSREKFEKADKTNMLANDIGVYYPILGKSNTEIAAEARSMHKCQGFGATGTRGQQMEYLEYLGGIGFNNKKDLFAGINTSWTRVKGGEGIQFLVDKIDKSFDHQNPGASIPALMDLRNRLNKLQNNFWAGKKLHELDAIIEGCLGLYLEAVASDHVLALGDSTNLSIEMINRSKNKVVVKAIHLYPHDIELEHPEELECNIKSEINKKIPIENLKISSPYWINNKATEGFYHVENQKNIGLAENKRQLEVKFDLEIAGSPFPVYKKIVYKENDRVKGEVYKPLEIVAPVSVSLTQDVIIFENENPKEIVVNVKSFSNNTNGTIALDHPDNWYVSPSSHDFSFSQKGEEKRFSFKLVPPENQEVKKLNPVVKIGDNSYTEKIDIIDYEYIPTQTLSLNASAKIVRLDIQKRGLNVAYVMGAGDKVPESLRQIGYSVDLLSNEDIYFENLQKYDACIIGIRAYNTNKELKFKQNELNKYMESGGNVIVQYNTSRRLSSENLAPYPLKLSRDRVTDEYAEVRLLLPEHEALNYPNKIVPSDFEGWVQERGLYFPNEWNKEYEALLSMNDPGEEPKNGSLLIAKYGEGYYVYSGISWFRELPAGVPGAYRLLANLISLGQKERP